MVVQHENLVKMQRAKNAHGNAEWPLLPPSADMLTIAKVIAVHIIKNTCGSARTLSYRLFGNVRAILTFNRDKVYCCGVTCRPQHFSASRTVKDETGCRNNR